MASPLVFRENVPLAPYTTFQIGGPARWFAEARSETELLQGVIFARQKDLPLFVLGGGSNLLVADTGFAGVVLRVALKGIEEITEGSERIFRVAAGEDWDGFVSHAVSRDCGGIECLAGIPGTVGGTPVQNVGAYGQEVSGTIVSVRAIDLKINDGTSEKMVELSAAECGFAYRQSIFNTIERGRYIVTRVDYRLAVHAEPKVDYADVEVYFKDRRESPDLQKVTEAVRAIRDRKGMLLVPGEADCRSAGSFFKNPIVREDVLGRLASLLGIETALVPRFASGRGMVKIPAAWLLDQAGFHKGFALGAAGISTRHTLALTNRGDAKAADVLALSDRIVETVAKRFGIRLEPEPVFVGLR